MNMNRINAESIGPEPRPLRAVLWDMDGVLVDTAEFHFQAWQTAAAEMGVSYGWELFKQTFGMNNRKILSMLLGELPETQVWMRISERKEAAFRQAIQGKAQPLPGVQAWLERLQRLGRCQAIASSAPQENIDALVDELGFRSYFSAIVSAYDLPGKPDPAVFLEAARRLSTPPESCIVIEDAIPGVEAARRAGMKCIAVTNTNPRQALASAGRIVDSLEELKEEDFEV